MIEIHRILCPVDFSDTSLHALDVAMATAGWYGARVDVLHVHQDQPAVDIIPSLAAAPAVQYAAREKAHAEIHRLGAELLQRAAAARVPAELVLRDESSVHRAVLRFAEETHPDLIVMGTHGRTGLERWLLGSTVDRVVRTSSTPVMVVPPRVHGVATPGAVDFDSILCAIDFSAASSSALTYALSLAEEADAHLTLLNVIAVPPELEPGSEVRSFDNLDVDAIRAAAEARRLARLRQLVPDEARQYCHVHTVVAEGSAYHEIVREAADRRADLIVMGAQGHGAVDRMVFGSQASQVIRAAPCPVLIVPSGTTS